MSVEIDFAVLTNNGKVHNLVGKEKGEEARRRFKLDELDASGGQVVVVIPDSIYAVSSSFWSGLFADTIAKYGREGFLSKYKFKAPFILQKSADLNAWYMERKLAS